MSDWVERGLGLSSFQNDSELEKESVVLINGRSSHGEKIFAYVLLNYEAYAMMIDDIIHQRAKHPTMYGRILAHGIGFPDLALQLRMGEKYNLVQIGHNKPNTQGS